jgi:hypothetical protein
VAVDALGALLVNLQARLDELLVEGLHSTGLTAGFGQPVQRQGDGDQQQQPHRCHQRTVELGGLQLVVVQVRLAVGGQFKLRTDLLAALAGLDHQVGHAAERDDDEHEKADRSLRGLLG